MHYTYSAYIQLLEKLNNNQYVISNYHDYDKQNGKVAILRHDVDFCLESAVKFAEIEHDMGVSSTYFVLLRTDFYNLASKNSKTCIDKIRNLGHEIGLHFDEASMIRGGDVLSNIVKEGKILSEICECKISTVSMHRPSKETLEADYKIPGMINSYSKVFFNEFKYLSDSRRMWREPVLDIVDSEKYDRLHILTHAFWYKEREEEIGDSVKQFILQAKKERYYHVADNIKDIDNIIDMQELLDD